MIWGSLVRLGHVGWVMGWAVVGLGLQEVSLGQVGWIPIRWNKPGFWVIGRAIAGLNWAWLRLDWLMGELGYDIIVLVFKVSLDGICGSLSNGGIVAVCVSFVLIP